MGSGRRNKKRNIKIRFCNDHVRQLAKPKKRLLMQTFLKHYAHFDIVHVEKIVVMLDNKITPEEAQRIIKEDRRKKISCRYKRDLNEVEIIVEVLLNIFKSFVCKNDIFNLDPFEEQLSAAIYFQLSNFIGIIISSIFSNLFN